MNFDPDFWRGRKVLLTGHTGFKGGWLALWLQSMGAEVCGYALAPNTSPALFDIANVAGRMESVFGDINDAAVIRDVTSRFCPEIVFHLAAQPLVRLSYREPIETYETNVIGTLKVLEAARHSDSVKAIVNITTDKCYENHEWHWGYRESDQLGGHDPYSSSKACAELLTAAYRRSYFTESTIGLASARAGNVIGGGDWAEDRLMPDLLAGLTSGTAPLIRNPQAVRPWQHVLEPLSGYLMLAQGLFDETGPKFAEAWNFGPSDTDCRSVGWVCDALIRLWGDETISWAHDDRAHPHEATFLKLDCSKSQSILGWQPRWGLEKALSSIVDWHRAFGDGADMHKFTIGQIAEYQGLMG